jgi:Holliday junction resolvase RusA-like endonuclease
MSDCIKFTVYGEPKSQKRHRHSRVGKFVKTYDPSTYEKDDFLIMCLKNRPKVPITSPIFIKICFEFTRPKSHYRTGKFKHLVKDGSPELHISKPDIDNLVKFVLDSLNKVYFKDDSQICKILATKKYTNETPKTTVEITVL